MAMMLAVRYFKREEALAFAAPHRKVIGLIKPKAEEVA
jgi:hypothetical protein